MVRIVQISLFLLLFITPFYGADSGLREDARNSTISITQLTSQASSNLKLLSTVSTIRTMSQKDLLRFEERLGSSKRTELEGIIPEEKISDVATPSSCCFVFWKCCLKTSAKTLGTLAVNLILDLSDGKLDGKGPNGPINYIDNLIDIVHTGIEEFAAARQ